MNILKPIIAILIVIVILLYLLVPKNTANVGSHNLTPSVSNNIANYTTSNTIPVPNASVANALPKNAGTLSEINLSSPISLTAYDPLNKYVYFISQNGEVTIVSGNSIVGNTAIKGQAIYAINDTENGYVYIMAEPQSPIPDQYGKPGEVYVLNGTNLIGIINFNGTPDNSIFDPFDGYVYITTGLIRSNRGPSISNITVINGTHIVGVLPGSYPVSIASGPLNGYIYTVEFNGTTYVAEYAKEITTLQVGEDARTWIANPSNGYVYLLNYLNSSVSIINGAQVIDTINVGSNPWSATYDSLNGDVYVGSLNGPLYIIKGTSTEGILEDSSGVFASIYDPYNHYVYALNNGVTIISNTTLLADLLPGSSGLSLIYDSFNHYVYETEYNGEIEVINNTKLLGSFSFNSIDQTTTYNPYDGDIYLTSYGTNSVYVISP